MYCISTSPTLFLNYFICSFRCRGCQCDLFVVVYFVELARQLLAGADEFDTRAWAVAVGIVMGTLILLGLGTCFLLYQECRIPSGK